MRRLALALLLFIISDTAWAYEPEAVTLFAAMTTQPTTYRKSVINDLILTLKNAGVWAKLDVFYVLAVADTQQSSLNWKAPASNTTTDVGSPTFTADVGISNGVYQSICRDIHWTPSTQAVNFTQNNASIFAWSGSNVRASGEYFWGQPSGAVALALNPWNAVGDQDTASVSINDAGGSHPGSVGDASGLFTATRSASTGYDFYRNTTLVSSVTQTSTGLPAVSMLIGATSRIMKMGGAASALSAQNITDLFNAFNTYLSCIVSGSCTYSIGGISPLEPKPAPGRLFNGFE